MKKIVLFMITFLVMPLNIMAISARNAIVMDLNSGRVLYDLNSHDEHLIASITKIMTAFVTIKYGDLDKIVVANDSILKAYGSSIYLTVGEEMKLKDLLYGLMLRSGNDAAVVIAEAVGGSMEGFAYLMNDMAKSIGMKNTKFINAHGLDSNGIGNTSSAYDMALLTKSAMQNKTFREIFGTKEYTAKSNLKTYNWETKNKIYSIYKFATGGKTGYTDKARRTLVTTASKDNKNLVVVTLNDGNDFNDHKSLYETYFNKYEAVLTLDKKNFKVDDNYYKNGELYIKNDYYALVTKEEAKNLKIDISIYKNDKVYNNDIVGEAKVMLNDTVLHKENIYIKLDEIKKEKKISLWQRIIRWFKSW